LAESRAAHDRRSTVSAPLPQDVRVLLFGSHRTGQSKCGDALSSPGVTLVFG
jgi:hypothetical protein